MHQGGTGWGQGTRRARSEAESRRLTAALLTRHAVAQWRARALARARARCHTAHMPGCLAPPHRSPTTSPRLITTPTPRATPHQRWRAGSSMQVRRGWGARCRAGGGAAQQWEPSCRWRRKPSSISSLRTVPRHSPLLLLLPPPVPHPCSQDPHRKGPGWYPGGLPHRSPGAGPGARRRQAGGDDRRDRPRGELSWWWCRGGVIDGCCCGLLLLLLPVAAACQCCGGGGGGACQVCGTGLKRTAPPPSFLRSAGARGHDRGGRVPLPLQLLQLPKVGLHINQRGARGARHGVLMAGIWRSNG